VAVCSSTAVTIERVFWCISSIIARIESVASTASRVLDWIDEMRSSISCVASAVWRASSFTSFATTAKPRPASPALAASIVAFSASRFVWSAMSLITPTTLPICSAATRSRSNAAVVSRALRAAFSAIPAE
jgi:predicted DNA-binding ribbon-helix-helix protein